MHGEGNVYDLAILANNYCRSTGGGLAALTTSGQPARLPAAGGQVPEPAAIILLAATAGPMVWRRRRRA